MTRRPVRASFVALAALAWLPLAATAAVQLKVSLPLGRTAYQTNEWIDLAVVRSDAAALPAADLTLTLAGSDASQAVFVFPVAAVPVVGADARATEHLHLNGWLLRPGAYTVSIVCTDAAAQAKFEVFSHVRRSPFKLIDWGTRANGPDLTKLGEDGMGFNLIYGNYRQNTTPGNADATIRGGADFMQVCTMSGAHQMDLRSECDWSDPLVIRGGTARVAQQAFISRTQPNAAGVHFYDEPGLTWAKHAKTGKVTPHNVPTQDQAFKFAYGQDALQYCDVKPDNPDDVTRWNYWARWKESFMDAAWKDGRFGVEQVKPDFISATQSVYGFTAYTDGYYFNVVRSLPVISGHGGYDDGVASYFYPSYHHEFGRMRDLNKPNWYLPAWYGGMSSEVFRLEQYLSFMVNLQGMAKPPDHQVHNPAGTTSAAGILESNKIMARLGTVFTVMPPTRGDVALLFSLSQCIGAQIKSMDDNYDGGGHTRGRLMQAYLAGKMLHIPFFPVVEEDIVDGTVAANHKAIVLAGVNSLDAKVTKALETYAAGGGAVILTAECEVQVKGAIRLDVAASLKQYDLINKLWATDQKESVRQRAAWHFMKEAEPLAKALGAQFAKLGIAPVIICDNLSVIASRQAQGDIEYLFAVNAAGDEKDGGPLALQASTATISLPGGTARPVYDAVRGGAVAEFAGADKNFVGQFRFGPGQMRVFARTARPIGRVSVAAPVLARDFTVAQNPLQVQISATLLDNAGGVLGGAAPLQVKLIDPLGAVRYDLYRATTQGTCRIVLPLAANDPAGTWTVEVTELLANQVGKATFAFAPAAQCGALAGATSRAVYFGNDRDNAFRMARTQSRVTIVKGTSAFHAAAAERLATALQGWGVRATVVNAADVNKARVLTPEEAKTWVGLAFGRAEAGEKNPPYKVGYAIDGAAILLGNPTDNPLIAAVAEWGFLPYKATPDFPGRGRGYLAWQRDAIGIGQESVTLIAYDAVGLSEAVGTFYEAIAGLDPLLPLSVPVTATVTAATKAALLPEATIAWQAVLPDRAVWLKSDGAGISVYTLDGSEAIITGAGKVLSQKAMSADKAGAAPAAMAVPDALKAKLVPARVVKLVAGEGGLTAVAYWGGTLQVFDAAGEVKAQQLLPQDISGLAWAGGKVVAALADGRVLGLQLK